MEFTDNENVPGILIFIYFRKAFDTLEWNCNLYLLNKKKKKSNKIVRPVWSFLVFTDHF